MMMNIPDNIGKRDIKREFKAAGYGSIDTIVFKPEVFEGYNTVYIWFRPTSDEAVLQKRREPCGTYNNCIDICCEKTPRSANGCGDRWFLLKNEDLLEPPIFDEKTQQEMTVMNMDIKTLALIVERHKNIIYQLLGGLFSQGNQSYILDDYLSYLFDGEHKPVPEDEDILPTTRQCDKLERRVKELNDTYERKLAAIEKRFENIERGTPSVSNDTYERKLAALEKRFDDFEFQLPTTTSQNDTYNRKLAALEKHFEMLHTEMSHTASLTNNIDSRLRAAGQFLTRDL